MTDIFSPVSPLNPGNKILEKNKTISSATTVYREGVENIPLPSKGYLYSGAYKNIQSLRLKPMDWTDDDILTTASFWEDGSIYIELLKNAIIDDNLFNANSLVPVDRDMLLLWLRSTSLGNEVKVNYYCPVCGHGGKVVGKPKENIPGEIIWNLKEFKIPTFDEKYEKELSEQGEYEITTPISQLKLKITVPTISQALKIEKGMEMTGRDIGKSSNISNTLLAVINGIVLENNSIIRNKEEIKKHLSNIPTYKNNPLPLLDGREILKVASDLNIKFDTGMTFVCKTKGCGHTEEGVALPLLHKNFFWPES